MDKIRVAITGGIGSGKSLALQYLSDMEYPVFSCDEIYKEVIQSKQYIEQIALFFPSAVINDVIDRKKLAKLVFDDQDKRDQLNRIAHPMIIKVLNAQMDMCSSSLVFAEVPLLFEGNYEKNFDKIIYIYRDKQARISNVMARDGLSQIEVEKRISTQFDPDQEEGKARLQETGAYVIKNNGAPHDLKEKLLEIISSMKQYM